MYVEYLPGNSPLIFSVPHGGSLRPESIPDRTTGCMETDSFTVELAHEIFEIWPRQQPPGETAIPHFVICLLHRTKIDANRNRESATDRQNDGNPSPADQVWIEYHALIDKLANDMVQSFGHVFIVDLHGQSHRKVPELGYLLTSDDLQLNDEALDKDLSLIDKCSLGAFMPTLSTQQLSVPFTLSQMVRGPHSLGAILSDRWCSIDSNRVVSAPHQCLPSPALPRPLVGETYFWGAYTCSAHSRGLSWNPSAAAAAPTNPKLGSFGGTSAERDAWVGAGALGSRKSAAVQLEVDWATRADPAARRCFARALACALPDFLAGMWGPTTLRTAAEPPFAPS